MAADCWLWTGPRFGTGYGATTGGKALAHRVAYEAFVGPIPDGHEIHHTCHTRLCVNPAHLEAVTRARHNKIEPRRYIHGRYATA